jgi:hypothetical protein
MESWLLTFGAALSKVAAEDPAVHNIVVEVQRLLKPGSAYEAPEIADRIMAATATMRSAIPLDERHQLELQHRFHDTDRMQLPGAPPAQ